MHFPDGLLKELVVFGVIEYLTCVVIVPERVFILFEFFVKYSFFVWFFVGFGEFVFCYGAKSNFVVVIDIVIDDVLWGFRSGFVIVHENYYGVYQSEYVKNKLNIDIIGSCRCPGNSSRPNLYPSGRNDRSRKSIVQAPRDGHWFYLRILLFCGWSVRCWEFASFYFFPLQLLWCSTLVLGL